MQFQPLTADGILFYVAQRLKAESGKVRKIFAEEKKNSNEFLIGS